MDGGEEGVSSSDVITSTVRPALPHHRPLPVGQRVVSWSASEQSNGAARSLDTRATNRPDPNVSVVQEEHFGEIPLRFCSHSRANAAVVIALRRHPARSLGGNPGCDAFPPKWTEAAWRQAGAGSQAVPRSSAGRDLAADECAPECRHARLAHAGCA